MQRITYMVTPKGVHVQSNPMQTAVTNLKNQKPKPPRIGKKKPAILNGLDWFSVPLVSTDPIQSKPKYLYLYIYYCINFL